jgi:hypothetical protein
MGPDSFRIDLPSVAIKKGVVRGGKPDDDRSEYHYFWSLWRKVSKNCLPEDR